MPGASRQAPLKRLIPTPRERLELRKRMGAFIRKRREELGLSQGDIIHAMGYTSRNSVSNLETGREGLPAKRIYAWAEILQVPRDAFFRFVTGETERMEDGRKAVLTTEGERLSPTEAALITAYRRLPPKYQRRLRENALEFATLVHAQARAPRK